METQGFAPAIDPSLVMDGPPVKKKAVVNNQLLSNAVSAINTGPLTPKIDTAQIIPINKPQATNYTPTKDPNVVIGKHGAIITRQQYEDSLKAPNNNMKFVSFDAYADYVGGWAGADYGKKPDNGGNMQLTPAQKILNNKPTLDLSDKAKGYSNSYYRANQ